MKDLETGVAIVGGGAAALSASVMAAEGGAKVAVFEKAATLGGTGNMAWGLLGIESRLQRLKQIGLTREEAFEIFMDYTHWRVDARLVKAYLDRSGGTIDWLESLGVEFAEPAAYFFGGNFTWHRVKSTPTGAGPGGGDIIIKTLAERARALGVQLNLRTPVNKILKEGNRVTGLVAEDDSGEEVRVRAGAVIVATGGFGDNPEMIKKYTGYEYGRNLLSMRIPGMAGEGIRMAWETGAAPSPMNMELIYGFVGQQEPDALSVISRQPNLLVNLQGERFMNEAIMGNNAYTGNAIAMQQDGCAFIICDEDTKNRYRDVTVDQPWPVNPLTKLESIDEDLKKGFAQEGNAVCMADTLEELAAQMGVDKDGLLRTVAEYNEICAAGRDTILGKDYKYLRPVAAPRFYACRLAPSAYGSLGGIKINHKTEVVAKDYRVIPGLYAAGTDACSIFGDTYVFILPGNTMGFAVNSGRMAGENAAAYVKSV